MSESIRQDLKGTWGQALMSFLLPICLLLSVRWFFVEPFLIPSESMLPNLLVNDHILVKKFSYGLKLPFASQFLVMWSEPKRGEIIVFRYPSNPDVFYVKRVIGEPGDIVRVKDGRVKINGVDLSLTDLTTETLDVDYYRFSEESHVVQFENSQAWPDSLEEEFKVPSNQYFVMGDNRHHSADSRAWGFVDKKLLVGQAWLIWMSCDHTLSSMKFLCHPSQIRRERIFKKLDN